MYNAHTLEVKPPFNREKLEQIISKHPTPFHIYDERAIRENARYLLKSFAWNQRFKEYFAVKATPNPFILKILKSEGFGTDCSSLPELLLSEMVGITGRDIMFSSNDTPAEEYVRARELGAIINLDDISHIAFLEKNAGIPDILSVRYNPGRLREGSFIMGNPEQAKYGFTREQVFDGLKMLQQKRVQTFGIHTFIASNELDPHYFIKTAAMMFNLAIEIKERLGIKVSFVNLSGGVGIPYKPEEKAVDLEFVGEEIRKRYQELLVPNGIDSTAIFMECGRLITGPCGYLVSKVLHIKNTYKTYVGLDANMAHLMRPAIYGAYHHITITGREHEPCDHIYDVTGSLCEPIDRFAVDRSLPKIDIGDVMVIHDTGAHGHAMGFNYNGKLRCAELLLRENGEVLEIRRAESIEDYFATLDFSTLANFK